MKLSRILILFKDFFTDTLIFIARKIQAFIYDATTLEYAVGRDVGCKLKSVGKRYAETGYGIGFRNGSRWVKKFNKVLLDMQRNGWYTVYKCINLYLACRCVNSVHA